MLRIVRSLPFVARSALAGFSVAQILGCVAEPEADDFTDNVAQDLSTALIQAESQSWSASSGDKTAASSTNVRLNADASGDNFSFSTSVATGTYQVVVRYAQRNVYGNYRVEVKGAQVGTISGYSSSSSDSWQQATLGTASLSGTVQFRFVSTGKSSSSSDYDIKVDYIQLVPTSGSGGSGGSSGAGGSSGGGGTSPPPPPPPPPPASGSPSCTFPAANGQQSVSSTISVSGTLDGGMKRYVGSGALGTSGQSESQDPIFELANGATLKNLIIGNPAADGVHCKGSCTLENVYWEDVGEDAATLKGSSSSQTMTITGGAARSASDKIFQHNGPGTMTIRNFCADTFGKLYRSCGNCSTQYKRAVVIDNVIARSGKAIVGINTNYGDTARITRLTVTGNPSICDKYTGNSSGAEPPKVGSGPDGTNCIYSSSDVTKQ